MMKRGIESYFSRIPKKQAAGASVPISPPPALACKQSPPRSCTTAAAAITTAPPSSEQGAGSTQPPHHTSQPISNQQSVDVSPTPQPKHSAADHPSAGHHASIRKQADEVAELPPVTTLSDATIGVSVVVTLHSAVAEKETESVASEAFTHVVLPGESPAAGPSLAAAASPTAAAAAAASPAVAAAGFLAVAPAVVLDAAALREVARRNQDLVVQALATASAAGSPPDIKALLAEPSWKSALSNALGGSKTRTLQAFMHKEWSSSAIVFPPKESIFRAMNACPLDQVRVVILGQDPYHGSGEAMGLSFSVPRGIKVPSSLSNMFKELGTDVGFVRPGHGCLEPWAHQGVLMLNTLLTVRSGAPLSHAKQGWEVITDAAISAISARRKGVVFLLWGKTAQDKMTLIDMKKHHVLTTSHPSGLSASRGFIGCKHFSKANAILVKNGLPPVQWQL